MRNLLASALFALSIALGGDALAQSQPGPDPVKLEEAKTLFKQGNELRKAGDCQSALGFYMKSRGLVASSANTMNAAYCLDQVGRYDEALELYEDVLTRFRDEITDADRDAISPAVNALRHKVGGLEISSNVDGILVVDGKMRGQLPLPVALRVLPGRRVVRVIKDGWQSYEAAIDIEPGKTVSVDARLQPLTSSGRLRVECPTLPEADVLIEGVRVGGCPWEGTLAPGPHVYSIHKEDMGSSPTATAVLQGQTITVVAPATKVGPEFTIGADPIDAMLLIDGVAVGTGSWRGALPLGPHMIEARANAYIAGKAMIDGGAPGAPVLKLYAEPSNPGWVKPPTNRGSFAFELDGDAVFFAGPGSTLRRDCASPCKASLPLGAKVTARFGYVLPLGVGFSLDAAYVHLGESFTQRKTALNPVGLAPGLDKGSASDEIRMHAALIGASASFTTRSLWPFTARVGAGALIGRVTDYRTGTFQNSAGASFPATQKDDELAAYFIVAPEARIGRRIGPHAQVDIGVTALFGFALAKPSYRNSAIVPTSSSASNRGDGGATFPADALLDSLLVAIAPGLGFRYAF